MFPVNLLISGNVAPPSLFALGKLSPHLPAMQLRSLGLINFQQ